MLYRSKKIHRAWRWDGVSLQMKNFPEWVGNAIYAGRLMFCSDGLALRRGLLYSFVVPLVDGGWLVENDGGEIEYYPDSEFHSLFEPVEDE